MINPCKNNPMQNIPLKLQDLAPKEAKFTLADFPNQEFTLKRWSLRVRTWALEHYTSEELREVFEKQQIEHIAILAYHLLKEKEVFLDEDGAASLNGFLDHVSSVQDQINVIKALLTTVGIGEPEMEKINEALAKEQDAPKGPNVKAPKKKIGAKSLTP